MTYGFGFEIPIRTRTENNNDEHWRVRAKRAKLQRTTACQYLWSLWNQGYQVQLPITITLIRVAPRTLDEGDNSSSSSKHIRDGIADFFELPDNDPRMVWRYAQMKYRPHYYAVRVVLEPQGISDV